MGLAKMISGSAKPEEELSYAGAYGDRVFKNIFCGTFDTQMTTQSVFGILNPSNIAP